MDGNNQIMPIAYGVGKTESGECWTWFLTKLKECFHEDHIQTIVSDRANSIDTAVRNVFPQAFHGLCCRHLSVNLKLRSFKGKRVAKLFWKACKAYNEVDFQSWYTHLGNAAPRVVTYLEKIDKQKWTRAYCPADRFNVMTSNSVESMNALSLHARRLPIVMLIDFFRSSLQRWFYNRRMNAEKLQHTLTTWAESKIKRRMTKSNRWIVEGINNHRFQVVDNKRRMCVVDLQENTCHCQKWQRSGLPCGHVISVARYLKLSECSQWTMKWFTKEFYQATYEDCVYPVPHSDDWEFCPPDAEINVHPPLMNKRQAGRPRNVTRIPSRGEEVLPTICSRCGEVGHNRDSCRKPNPSQSSSHSTPPILTTSNDAQPSGSEEFEYKFSTW